LRWKLQFVQHDGRDDEWFWKRGPREHRLDPAGIDDVSAVEPRPDDGRGGREPLSKPGL
jgi:hypothetical protein